METIAQLRGSAIALSAAAFPKDSISLLLSRDVDRAQRGREAAEMHDRFHSWSEVDAVPDHGGPDDRLWLDVVDMHTNLLDREADGVGVASAGSAGWRFSGAWTDERCSGSRRQQPGILDRLLTALCGIAA